MVSSSLAMTPARRHESWGLYRPPPSSSEEVRQLRLNFGAPGDRIADNGTLWLDVQQVEYFRWSPGTCQRTFFALRIKRRMFGKIILGSLIAVTHNGHKSLDGEWFVWFYRKRVAIYLVIASSF